MGALVRVTTCVYSPVEMYLAGKMESVKVSVCFTVYVGIDFSVCVVFERDIFHSEPFVILLWNHGTDEWFVR